MILNGINDSLCTGTRALDRELLESNPAHSPTTPVDKFFDIIPTHIEEGEFYYKNDRMWRETVLDPLSYVKRVLCIVCQLSNDQWKSEDTSLTDLVCHPVNQPLDLESIIATRYAAYSISWRNGAMPWSAANQYLSSNTGLPVWGVFDTIHNTCDYSGIVCRQNKFKCNEKWDFGYDNTFSTGRLIMEMENPRKGTVVSPLSRHWD